MSREFLADFASAVLTGSPEVSKRRARSFGELETFVESEIDVYLFRGLEIHTLRRSGGPIFVVRDPSSRGLFANVAPEVFHCGVPDSLLDAVTRELADEEDRENARKLAWIARRQERRAAPGPGATPSTSWYLSESGR